MSEIDAEATAQRTLDIRIAKLPYNLVELPERYADTFRKAGARTAYTFRDKRLVPIMYLAKKDQDFVNYATQWEKLHSSLILGDGGGHAFPVVSEGGVIIGHYGEFKPEDFYTSGAGDLESQVDQGVVVVDYQPGTKHPSKATTQEAVNIFAWTGRNVGYKQKGYSQYHGSPQQSITVITDLEGYVVQVVRTRSRDGIEPVYYSPLDLIAIPRLFLLVGRAAAKKIILTLARRRARKDAARGAARELNPPPPPPSKLPIHGDPPQVRVGSTGEPGNLLARVDVTREGEVIYRVTHIVLRGAGDDAAIALARASHREMIRRAAQQARKAGKKRFTMLGEQANQNFQKHADELANTIGVRGSGKRIHGTAGEGRDYEVTLDVDKVLK